MRNIVQYIAQKTEQKKLARIQRRQKQRKNYERVYFLHEQAKFLCYINDVYEEMYEGEPAIKLEGLVAKGKAGVEEQFVLYSCNGLKKADITMEEFYVGRNRVNTLEGGDQKVALYPREQNVKYLAGDILSQVENTPTCINGE